MGLVSGWELSENRVNKGTVFTTRNYRITVYLFKKVHVSKSDDLDK